MVGWYALRPCKSLEPTNSMLLLSSFICAGAGRCGAGCAVAAPCCAAAGVTGEKTISAQPKTKSTEPVIARSRHGMQPPYEQPNFSGKSSNGCVANPENTPMKIHRNEKDQEP